MKFVKEFVYPAAVLTIICIVISAALVLTYNTTEPIIEAAKRAAADEARSEVLQGAGSFEKVEVKAKNVVEAYKETNNKGFVITGKANGYGGEMQVMVGITADGKIDKVKLMDNNETEGIGSQVGLPKYTDQYKGKDMKLDGIDAVTGATVSSGAFKSSVTSAFEAYAELAGVEVEKPSFEKMAYPTATKFEEMKLEGALKAFKADEDGYVIVVEEQGYSGAPMKMQVYVGINKKGEIVNVALGENGETQGLGSRVGEEAHTKQFVGKTQVEGINAISGATESSEGFEKAVAKALELFKTIA